jgi:hypothetical protein
VLETIAGTVLNLAAGTFSDWIGAKAEASREKAKARAEAVKNGIPGWSDEWLVLVWSFPAVACFVPGLDAVATAGIERFNAMPGWYQYGFFMVTGAVFGLDKFVKLKQLKP